MRKTEAVVIGEIALITSLVFALDIATEIGVATAVLYVAAVGLSYRSKTPHATLAVAAACSALTLLGFALEPERGEAIHGGWNCALALGAIAISAVLCQRAKRAESDLREQKEDSRAIIDSSLDAVVAIDQSGAVIDWNPQATHAFGWERDEVLGRNIAELIIPSRDRDAHFAGMQRFLATGVGPVLNQRLEFEALRRGGGTFPVELVITATHKHTGWQFSGFVRDITDQKRVQREIRSYAEDLRRSNEELDAFAYSASHDLKAPLRAIENLAEWIAEDAGPQLPALSREHLATLRKRVARMRQLLDDLLAYSRIGRTEHEVEEIDARALVEEVVQMLSPPAAFTVKIAPLPGLRGHRAPLAQVFHNLIGNAIKHHHRADGCVEVGADLSGSWIEFAVRDDGPGIDPKHHQKVFGMFETLRPLDEIEGSGLGLAIVKKTVEGQGGRITLESQLGAGATFRFTWPLAPQSEGR